MPPTPSPPTGQASQQALDPAATIATLKTAADYPQLIRFLNVFHHLRSQCPWDAEQTHLSLVSYLVEETCEAIEAIEAGSDSELEEELGDLLLQVIFHAEIASETKRFDIESIAKRIADKLIARHPYVFSDAELPENLLGTWEKQKTIEKQRTRLTDGIPERMSALSRATKVFSRADSHGFAASEIGITPLKVEPAEIGTQMLRLAASAVAAGLDPEQELRTALRTLEAKLPPIG
ncbi:MAG: nucleoside triphosphate pyrophosphohydrolase [Propionibacteriaceae bacterium]|nr:nucleoside triphosphate pyrophosphohydrolase [Propionibacteriaceae bacterium]